jgi:hypothetical protein
MNGNSCPICAGPLDAEGLCPSCIDGPLAGPALAADGTLAQSDPAPVGPFPGAGVSPPVPPPERTLPPPPPAPDPGHGVPLELDLSRAPARSRGGDGSLELDERALASIRSRSREGIAATVPVERRPRPRRRRWPWLLALVAALLFAGAAGLGAKAWLVAEGLVEQALSRLPGDGKRSGKPPGERLLAPGIAGAILMVDSEPSGADVFLGDQYVGVTPLAVDNPYPDGERFEVTVKKRGYLEARLAADGGEPAHLEVKLIPARKAR